MWGTKLRLSVLRGLGIPGTTKSPPRGQAAGLSRSVMPACALRRGALCSTEQRKTRPARWMRFGLGIEGPNAPRDGGRAASCPAEIRGGHSPTRFRRPRRHGCSSARLPRTSPRPQFRAWFVCKGVEMHYGLRNADELSMEMGASGPIFWRRVRAIMGFLENFDVSRFQSRS